MKVLSLELCEAEGLAEVLGREIGCDVEAYELSMSELGRNREARSRRFDELTILLHYCEGRTLLVDRDGLYNSWLCEHWGNIALALRRVATPESRVASDEAIAELVDSGQASIWSIHRLGRFLTWDDQPSQTHLGHLKALRDDYFPPFEPTPDMLECHGQFPPPTVSFRPKLARAIARNLAVPVLANITTALRALSAAPSTTTATPVARMLDAAVEFDLGEDYIDVGALTPVAAGDDITERQQQLIDEPCSGGDDAVVVLAANLEEDEEDHPP